MKARKLCKRSLALMVASCIVAALLPTMAFAGVTDTGDDDAKVIRKTRTDYYTTVVFEGTLEDENTGETQTFNKESEEIAGDVKNADVQAQISDYKSQFGAWVEEKGGTVTATVEGISDYHFVVHDEITDDMGDGVILVGDPDDLTATGTRTITVLTILEKFQTYKITSQATVEKESPNTGNGEDSDENDGPGIDEGQESNENNAGTENEQEPAENNGSATEDTQAPAENGSATVVAKNSGQNTSAASPKTGVESTPLTEAALVFALGALAAGTYLVRSRRSERQ